jgi:putative membrane protein
MVLDPDAAARVEAAFDAAQLKTRAPLVCVLAGASTSLDGEFLLGACILALLTPLPLLLFTDLSAHRIYIAQLLVAILAAVLVSLPPVRRWLIPKRIARSAGHRAALAQFVLRGIDRSRCGALIYVSLAEHYIRIVPAEDAARAVANDQWQIAVNDALGPLAAGETEAALAGLAEDCSNLLAGPFPPGEPADPKRQRFHIV